MTFLYAAVHKNRDGVEKHFNQIVFADINDENDNDFNDCSLFHFLNIFKLSIK